MSIFDAKVILHVLVKNDDACLVEVVYLVKSTPLTTRGQLAIGFPQCDVPINQLFAATYLPYGYKYGQFTGLKEVTNWSATPPSKYSNAMQINRQRRYSFQYEDNFKKESKNMKSKKVSSVPQGYLL